MTDLILPFLSLDMAALLLIAGLACVVPQGARGSIVPQGARGSITPRAVASLAITGLSGLGVLLCLPPLITPAPATALVLPVGPPGLALHLVLDPVAAFFLLAVFGCGAAVAGCSATGSEPPARSMPLALAGLVLILLAADAVVLGLGLALVAAALGRRVGTRIVTVVMAVVAVCLLAPDHDSIRGVPAGAWQTAAAGILVASTGLLLTRAGGCSALSAGAVIPVAIYLPLRLMLDAPGGATPAWWGFVVLAVAGVACVIDGWQAARDPGLVGSVAGLTRRQWGLAMSGLALTLIARSADLPDAAALALAATLLLVLISALAGTAAALAARAMTEEAATGRLDRLGGLIRTMPAASAALAAALLALSALPPAAGFAAIWLLFQSILSAPRTGGLIAQLPLALSAAALALSVALTTAVSVRLIGVAVLSRPRGVRASAARDVAAARRWVLLAPATAGLLIGVLPGPVLRALADPAIRDLTGAGLSSRVGWTSLAGSAASAGYAPLAVLALLAAVVVVIGIVRGGGGGGRAVARAVAPWTGGSAPMPTLPFGEPLAQSAGLGFVPPPPALGVRLPAGWTLPVLPRMRVPAVGLWALLLGFGGLLLLLSVAGG